MATRKTVRTVEMVQDKVTKNGKERFSTPDQNVPISGTIYVAKGEDAPAEVLVKLVKK